MKRGAEGIPELAPLKKLKVAELRTLCSSNQVPQTGTKDVMIQRLDSLRRSSSGKSSAVIPLPGSASTASRSGAATPESTSKQRRDQFFLKYANESGTKVELEGFVQLTLDIAGGDEGKAQLPETTIMLLFLSWKMGSSKFGEISKEGFKKGLEAMKCDSLEQVLQNRSRLLTQLSKVSSEYSPATYQMVSVDPFVTFYNFCFELLKPEGKKYVEKEMACVALTAIWKQVPLKQSPHIDTFVEFLNSQEKILSVNSDQWKSFVQFSKQVDGKLTGFSEDDPWPSLYDDYVAWFRQQLGNLGTTAP